ncbi:MAG: hypothetical protein A2Z25_00740 [Planctomycetes bacterium RBG_16_55_9]|nr:MAG: hypothetical protein A2Z25_00740 [Planctomycetes bacterium RBG_16_55_9]
MCYVYHYTTTEGFKGILESGEIWATSIYCLNDWTEFEYAREPFIDSVRALLKDSLSIVSIGVYWVSIGVTS